MANSQLTDDLPESEDEWHDRLSDQEYRILRESGTEPRNTSDLLHVDEAGTFRCAGCGQALYSSGTKFESGTGWPSFWAPVDEDAIDTQPDYGLLSERTEARCSRCDGHLGHVFDDGPDPTGKRHCINGLALDFDPEED